MSENDTSGQESNGGSEHECPVAGCGYTNTSEFGVSCHFGSHEDHVKEEVYLTEIRRVAEEIERTPRREDIIECSRFSRATYENFFGTWNAALIAAGYNPNKRRNITSDELLSELHRLSDELDHAPTTVDMREDGRFSDQIYKNRFGTWNTAVEAAGLDPTYHRDISDKVLVDEICRLVDEYGHTPRRKDMVSHGKYSPSVYDQRFGSWNDALRTAGFEPVKEQSISRETLIAEVQRLSDKLGRVPTASDMRLHGRYARKTYQRCFGSWNGVIKAAGYEPNKVTDIPVEDLIGEIHRLKSDLGRIPRVDDMDRHGAYSIRPYRRQFTSWYGAIEAAGFEPRTHEDWVLAGEDHPHYGGGPIMYGPGWTYRKKESVRERDGRECQHCGRCEEDHVELTGKKHSVHHIQKARSVNDPDQRNSMDNLVTLCQVAPQSGDRPCHEVWEEMSPLRPDAI